MEKQLQVWNVKGKYNKLSKQNLTGNALCCKFYQNPPRKKEIIISVFQVANNSLMKAAIFVFYVI